MLSNYASKPFRKLASSQTLLLCLLELQLIWCKIMETWCNQELIRLQTLYLTRMTHVIFSSVFCELGTSTCKSNSQLYKARLHKRLICDTGNGEQINLKIITGTKSENLSKCFLRVWQLSLFLINVNSVSYSWQKKNNHKFSTTPNVSMKMKHTQLQDFLNIKKTNKTKHQICMT